MEYLDFLVRSKGEVIIANWFCEHNIEALYEERLLGKRPDFYLPEYKLYIEYFGEYRDEKGTRTKEKMRLYKKYKIKCVYLFPKDLKKLDEKLGILLKNKKRKNQKP